LRAIVLHPVNRVSKVNDRGARTLPRPSTGQAVDRTNFPGLAPVSSPFSKMGTPEQIVMS
jgi:hypothetical protein